MALKPHSLILLLATFSLIIISSHAADCDSTSGNLIIYWGRNPFEGTLRKACESGNYNTVILAFLSQFGPQIEPKVSFADGLCGEPRTSCDQVLPSQIEYCQSQGIKVFLSVGSDIGGSELYNIPTAAYAKELGTYLWKNFLSGQHGPLGIVTLDGIDFFFKDKPHSHADELAEQLIALRKENNQKFYLSASPDCNYNYEPSLGEAIKKGRFDYIWVQFYYRRDNLCQYNEETKDPANLTRAWNEWSTNIPSNSVLFLGLSAYERAAIYGGGYIEPEVLKKDVLPIIKQASNYGGVMLWERYYDTLNKPSYSDQIKDAVGRSCRCVCDDDSFGFYGLSRKPM